MTSHMTQSFNIRLSATLGSNGELRLTHDSDYNAVSFGADNSGIEDAREAIMAAIAGSPMDLAHTGDGPIVRRTALAAGHYRLSKPVVITAPNLHLTGDQRHGTYVECTFCGPAFHGGRSGSLTVNAGDYHGLNSVTLGDGSIEAASKIVVLSRWGVAWELDGKSQMCLEMVVQVPSDQDASKTILSSSGLDPQAELTSAFRITVAAADLGYASDNLGIQLVLTTTTGVHYLGTTAGVIVPGPEFRRLRVDYDGTTLRLFLDNVLVESQPCTGTIVQRPWEAVTLGYGLSSRLDASEIFEGVPSGLRMASLRLAHVSRGDTDPTSGKYEEDGATKFLMNFDAIDGPLHFARTVGYQGGPMVDAWLPNAADENVNLQLPNLTIENMQIAAGHGGTAIHLVGCVKAAVRRIRAMAKNGIYLGPNSYFSTVEECVLSGDGAGVGITISPASNYCTIRNNHTEAFRINALLIAQVSLEGWAYWLTPSFANIWFSGTFCAEVSGTQLVSDEAAAAVGRFPEHGIVLDGTGTITIRGASIGHNSGDVSRQITIFGRHRPISADGKMHVKVSGCAFSKTAAAPNIIQVDQCVDGDTIVYESNDGGEQADTPFSFTGGSLAKVIVPEWETGPEWSVNYATNTDMAIGINDWLHGRVAITDTRGTLTDARAIYVPPVVGYLRWLRNKTAQDITVTTGAGTDVTLTAGATRCVYVGPGGVEAFV